MRRRKNDKPQESWMKLALHATEPVTRHSAAAQLTEYDLVAAAQLIEHNLVELIARIGALRVPAATRETKLWVGARPSGVIALLICYRASSACSSI
jgi:hypothetical protein